MGSECAGVRGHVYLCLVLALAAAPLLACGPKVEECVPADLQGRWITSAEKYDGRYLEIQPGQVVWGLDEWKLDEHAIEKVESRPDVNRQTRYWIHYTETAGYPATLELLLRRGKRTELRFANRPEVWTRASPM